MYVSYAFLRQKCVRLSWGEMLWGYENQIINSSDIIEFAADKLHERSSAIEIELTLIKEREMDQVSDLLQRIASLEDKVSQSVCQRKWLFLILSWLFENRTTVSDPFGEVEKIYADFDYPNEIESFVRYMPSTDNYDPGRHSEDENKARMFSNWQKYLVNAENEFRLSQIVE